MAPRKEPQLIRNEHDTIAPIHLDSRQTWRIFLTNLKLKAKIVNDMLATIDTHFVNVSASLLYSAAVPKSAVVTDQLVSYQQLVKNIEDLLASKHFSFTEMIAEEIAALSFIDARVIEAIIKVERANVVENVDSVGIEITRKRDNDAILLK